MMPCVLTAAPDRAAATCAPLACAGPRHVYYRDVDGTLTGSAGATILGAYLTPRADSLIDQVSSILPADASPARPARCAMLRRSR
jgi:hypothetical protein